MTPHSGKKTEKENNNKFTNCIPNTEFNQKFDKGELQNKRAVGQGVIARFV